MTIEQRLDQLEKRNKRLTVALTMTVVAMAATELKDGTFDIVRARHIYVMNDAGEVVVYLGVNDDGNGLVSTMSAKGNDLVDLTSTVGDNGAVVTYQPNGKNLVALTTVDGNGVVGAYNRKGMGRTLQPGP